MDGEDPSGHIGSLSEWYRPQSRGATAQHHRTAHDSLCENGGVAQSDQFHAAGIHGDAAGSELHAGESQFHAGSTGENADSGDAHAPSLESSPVAPRKAAQIWPPPRITSSGGTIQSLSVSAR